MPQTNRAAAPMAGTSLVPKPTRNRAHTTPKNLRKLCDRLGVAVAAQRLGYGESTIYTMLTNDACVKVVEVAATGLLEERDRDGDKRHLYMVKVPSEYREPVEKTLTAFGCQFRHFVE